MAWRNRWPATLHCKLQSDPLPAVVAQAFRPAFAKLRLSAAREAEIVEELSQHLDQRLEELRAGGTTEADARRLAIAELLEPDALADRMRSLRQAHVQPPVVLAAVALAACVIPARRAMRVNPIAALRSE